ncbi:MAG: hypothetical protein COA79_15750 [Planctomycetota bacterium]|nr:MAG: hypothetical protein COA79_15750 [Planctomycetota bacterium]
MRILFFASGFAPHQFSENIVNSKLVLSFINAGWKVDVISRPHDIAAYSSDWAKEWSALEPITHEITYNKGSKTKRLFDSIYCSIVMGAPLEGVRWAKRAFDKAIELHQKNKYDLIMSRSPSDISHLPAYHFAKVSKLKWIANWNDPAAHIWPKPYTKKLSETKKKQYSKFLSKIINSTDMNTFPSSDLRDYYKKHCHIDQSIIIPHIAYEKDNKIKIFKKQKFSMCHAGNLSSERNPEKLLQAISMFLSENPHVEINVDFLGVKDTSLELMVQKYSLQKTVRFLGSLPYNKAINTMSEYSVLMIIEADSEFGIYLPSKITDYAQLSVPIFAITPEYSCVHKTLDTFGGGIVANCTSADSISSGIKKLYDCWIADNNMNPYDSSKLYDCFSPSTIINQYKGLFTNLGYKI